MTPKPTIKKKTTAKKTIKKQILPKAKALPVPEATQEASQEVRTINRPNNKSMSLSEAFASFPAVVALGYDDEVLTNFVHCKDYMTDFLAATQTGIARYTIYGYNQVSKKPVDFGRLGVYMAHTVRKDKKLGFFDDAAIQNIQRWVSEALNEQVSVSLYEGYTEAFTNHKLSSTDKQYYLFFKFTSPCWTHTSAGISFLTGLVRAILAFIEAGLGPNFRKEELARTPIYMPGTRTTLYDVTNYISAMTYTKTTSFQGLVQELRGLIEKHFTMKEPFVLKEPSMNLVHSFGFIGFVANFAAGHPSPGLLIYKDQV